MFLPILIVCFVDEVDEDLSQQRRRFEYEHHSDTCASVGRHHDLVRYRHRALCLPAYFYWRIWDGMVQTLVQGP